MTRHGGLPVVDRIGIATTLGMLNGIAINTAHELGHKKEHLERWFARSRSRRAGYGHFFIEHNRGHHVRVATPDDPASSRLGEIVLGLLAAHRRRQPAQRLAPGADPAAPDGQAAAGRCATTSSTPGR